MITLIDTQPWSKELVTGNAQFIEIGSTVYIVSQVRADNTFAVFKSEPTPPNPGPGYKFDSTATYLFPVANTSFDPVVAYDAATRVLYIIGTQNNIDGKDYDVILFAYDTVTDTLGSPTVLVTASYVRDSYDICALINSSLFVAVAVTQPTRIGTTATVFDVTTPLAGSPPAIAAPAISISGDVLTAYVDTTPPTGWIGKDVTFSGLQNATFLNGVTVSVTSVGINSNGSFFTADYTYSDYVQEGYESGFVTWLPGHSLLAFEVSQGGSPPSSPPVFDLSDITVLDYSPFRTGNTFGAVSVVSPDGDAIEVYYESHPKRVTFTDQLFNLILATRSSSIGSPPLAWTLGTVLKTFTGRYADSRLTVIPAGATRTLLQQYYSQFVHNNALVGNLLLGYYDPTLSPPTWSFHTQPGSITASYIQGTLSISDILTSPPTVQAYVSYIAEPVYDIRGVWSPEVKSYDVDDRLSFNLTPGLDAGWVDYIVNTAITYTYKGAWTGNRSYLSGDIVKVTLPTHPVIYAFYTARKNIPVSVVSPDLDTVNWQATPTPNLDSRFSMAPTAWPLRTNTFDVSTFNMTDVPGFYNNYNFSWLRGSKTVLDSRSKWAVVGEYVGEAAGASYVSDFNVPPKVVLTPTGSINALRGTPVAFDASGTNDGDLDPVQFTWTFTPANPNVTLTPSGSTASFLVNRSIGGAAQEFIVGVVAVDYSGVTPLHPPMNITNIEFTSVGSVVTVTTDALVSLTSGEKVFLYSIATANFLNNQEATVISASGYGFTASISGFSHADYPATADTGKAIANQQYAFRNVSIPFNASPTIDFTHDRLTTQPVVLPIQAERNTTITINPTYTGVNDADDATTYTWTQLAGTPVTNVTSGYHSASLQFQTNGALIQGDTWIWGLMVDDGVNPAVPVYPLTSVINAAGQTTTYTGTFPSSSLAGSVATIDGFSNSANNGEFPVVSNTTVHLVVSNSAGVTETKNATASIPAIVTVVVDPYPFDSPDTLRLTRSVWNGDIAQRNTVQTWSPLDISVIYTNFQSIKRTSVLPGNSGVGVAGNDRYILISSGSVSVYGGSNPTMVLMRKLFPPVNNLLSPPVSQPVMDAVHTEDDWTLLLDGVGTLYRYTSAPLINTDNPDNLASPIHLSSISSQVFNKVFTTFSFANVRVIILTGPDGCLLLQVRNTDLAIQGFLELSVESGMLYGVDNVQFVRASNVESLSAGKLLLGTIAQVVANITSVAISGNTVTVVAPNSFTAGELVTFANLTQATFLNGVTASVVSATSAQFVISYEYGNYPVTTEGAGAVASTGGKTYETLIDLSHGQIIGTWDASKLRNQYVSTGEILFENNDTYAGRPASPVLSPIPTPTAVSVGYVNVTIGWVADRPDLIQSYTLESSFDSGFSSIYTTNVINNGYIQSITLTEPRNYILYFRVKAHSIDGDSPYSNTQHVNT
jgi:hypothetical protein